MSLESCILGLLALRPMSGYELKSTFDRSISYCWHSSSTQIYTALKALERKGMVQSHLVVQESKPNKRMYRVTPDGLNTLEEWLSSPVDSYLTKDEFLVRIFFASHVDDCRALQLLERHLASMGKQVSELQKIRSRVTTHPSRNPRARLFQLSALDLRVAGLIGMITEGERRLKELRSHSNLAR